MKRHEQTIYNITLQIIRLKQDYKYILVLLFTCGSTCKRTLVTLSRYLEEAQRAEREFSY